MGKGEKSGDRRVRRTKGQLRTALTELLRVKAPEDITVTELTELADVNRGTFYCHYRDIFDMLDQLEEEIYREFAALMDVYSASELRRGLVPILEDVFRFIQRNADLAGVLMRERAAFLERLMGVVREKVSREWSGLYRFRSAMEREYCLSFLMGGVMGLIRGWFVAGGAESAEEMAALAESLLLHGVTPKAVS